MPAGGHAGPSMFSDPLFWSLLLLKMAVTAGFVVLASLIAERASALIAAMIATLPISAGPAYTFIALQHDAHFVAQSALSSLSVNVVVATTALVYAMRAQRHGLLASIGPALAVWLGLALVVNAVPWTTMTAVLFNAVGLSLCIALGDRFCHAPVPPVPRRWSDSLVRAAMVAGLVAAVVIASEIVGPKLTGILAVFPTVLTSLMLILHRRIGGPATGAVLANTLIGLAGFAFCGLTAHLLVEPLGTAAGLSAALAVSIAANLLIWFIRRPQAAAIARGE